MEIFSIKHVSHFTEQIIIGFFQFSSICSVLFCSLLSFYYFQSIFINSFVIFPYFFFSLGQSAIFLLGGKTRDVVPVAMYMRSGDIMVMAGNSRLAYHAVPRILAPSEEQPIPLSLESETNSTTPQKSSALPLLPSMRGKCNQSPCEEDNIRHKRTKYEFEEDISSGDVEASETTSVKAKEFRLMRQYLSSSRININIRQVLSPGQVFPS